MFESIMKSCALSWCSKAIAKYYKNINCHRTKEGTYIFCISQALRRPLFCLPDGLHQERLCKKYNWKKKQSNFNQWKPIDYLNGSKNRWCAQKQRCSTWNAFAALPAGVTLVLDNIYYNVNDLVNTWCISVTLCDQGFLKDLLVALVVITSEATTYLPNDNLSVCLTNEALMKRLWSKIQLSFTFLWPTGIPPIP